MAEFIDIIKKDSKVQNEKHKPLKNTTKNHIRHNQEKDRKL